MAEWGAARVQFRAILPEIKQRLAAGESLHAVYGSMVAAGRISMSRSAFYKIHSAVGVIAPEQDAAQPELPAAAISKSGTPVCHSLPLVTTPSLPTVERAPRAGGSKDYWGTPAPAPAEPPITLAEDSHDAEQG